MLTRDDVDVGAAPERVALAPLAGLTEQPDRAVPAFEVLGQFDFVAERRRVARHETGIAPRQIENGLLFLVQHLDFEAASMRITEVPRHVERRPSQYGSLQCACIQ